MIKSRNARFKEGDFVAEYSGWQSHAVSNGAGVMKLDPKAAPLSTALSVLGMPGMTAWWGLMHIGQPKRARRSWSRPPRARSARWLARSRR